METNTTKKINPKGGSNIVWGEHHDAAMIHAYKKTSKRYYGTSDQNIRNEEVSDMKTFLSEAYDEGKGFMPKKVYDEYMDLANSFL